MHISPIHDSLRNLATGLGAERDKGAAGRFALRRRLNQAEILAMYRHNWFAGKVVDLPASDATSAWRAWNGAQGAVEAMEDIERRLQLPQRLRDALTLSARDGGSALLVGAGGEPWLPLDPATVQKGAVQFVHVVSRWDLSVEDGIERDPRSPWFGQARMWRMILPNGGQVRIHPSRVTVLVPGPAADRFGMDDPWSDSVYERLHDAIRDATSLLQAIATMTQEMKLDVVSIPGLNENASREEYRQALISRFMLANAMKGVTSALILDAEEEWDQKTLNFQGIPEVLDKLLSVVAGAADIPVTRLLGRSPAGMNATGQSDLEQYYSRIAMQQRTVITPALERLDEILIRSALGRRPRGLYCEWRPLWNMAETELSDVRLKHAQAARQLAATGLFDRDVLRRAITAQCEEDGFLPGIGDAPASGVPAKQPTEPEEG